MKKPLKYSSAPKPPDVLRDLPALTRGLNESVGMVRTQIYLTRTEHGFIEAEAARRGETMAAVIRGCIDDKMRVPDTAWQPTPCWSPRRRMPVSNCRRMLLSITTTTSTEQPKNI